MMIKYLEIDSTYRDRNQFPNPGQFNILNSQKGLNLTLSESLDPISLSAPIVTYVPGDIRTAIGDIIDGNTNFSNTIMASFFRPNYPMNKKSNYYRGISFEFRGASFILGPVVINSWDYMCSTSDYDTFRISFAGYIDPNVYPLVTYIEFLSSTNFSLGLVFIPNGTQDNQVYKGFYVYNENKNQHATILSYDGFYSLASIAPQPSWDISDTISIRQELPQTYGSFQSDSDGVYVFLSTSSDSREGFYNETILRITEPGSALQNKTYNIVWYSGAPNYTAKLNQSVGNLIQSGDTYEILNFTRDSFVPLIYSGTRTSQEVCYEIQNIALILPNITVEEGGIMQSYPYFYVEFQNISTSNNGNINTIYSNNPNSTRKLFRVPVSDISPSSISGFVKLDKTYMSQVIKLSPCSSFKLGVYLPDGRPLIFSIADTKSPLPPDPYLQLSILFSLKQVSF
jgi:hypothetical protein